MPSGVTHTRATMITALVVGATSAYLGATPETSFELASGALLGTILSPDADVDKGFYGFHVVRVLCGDTISFLYQLYLFPYAVLVKHRSFISHSPIVGTAIRTAYLFAIPLIITFTLNREYGISLLSFMAILFAGLCVSDTVHIALDVVVTAFKRTF